ncbi:peptide ABC transporter substrate-binding protein [Fusibacter sp. 3D3]|uniref:peptide ABC transporter substrate-binding protein n=1 Tax=Fusibacter sp. 3D3 TaxID=1048380 RepID=UPI000A9D285B|nr:peptide ABC transporter substrate-binding protein [Fusibacter sp. 3D3]
MFKRNLALLLVVMLVASMFIGCGSKPAEPTEPAATPTDATPAAEPAATPAAEVEQVLYWNISGEPKTIDPGLNAASDGGHVINNMFEGLMREINGKLEPAIAESYTMSEDGLVYTFKLRDAKWSDGQAITAQNFEWSWNRVLAEETASEYAWIFDEANVDSFKAIDEKTFEVTLKAPTPYFLGLTAFYTFFPVREDAVAKGADGAWAIDPAASIVNGPFMLESYIGGDRLVLVKNPNYWQADKVKLERIEALMIVEASTYLTAYESGSIDALLTPPTEEIPRLIAEDPTFYILPQDGTYYYSLNTEKVPMDNINVRKALSLAIDRKAICETVTKGGQVPALNMVSPASYDADGNLFSEKLGGFGLAETAQIEEAQALLAEAGYPNGEGFPKVELMYNTSEGHKQIAEAIQEMWKQNLNIDITLTNQEWAVFQDTRREGNYEIARAGWLGDYSDPMTYLGMFLSESPMNYPRWKSPEYDALIESARTAPGQERFEMLYKAASLMEEQYVNIPVYTYTNTLMVKEKVVGWEMTTRSTWFFGFAEITE